MLHRPSSNILNNCFQIFGAAATTAVMMMMIQEVGSLQGMLWKYSDCVHSIDSLPIFTSTNDGSHPKLRVASACKVFLLQEAVTN